MNLLDGNKIDCKRLYDKMILCIKTDVEWYFKKQQKFVCVLEGNDFGSLKYTELKKKTAEDCGINFEVINEDKFNHYCQSLNDLCGIIQLPAPKSLLDNVDYFDYTFTDIDYLTNKDNIPFLSANKYDWYRFKNPATVKAVLEILDNIIGDLSGKKIAIVGCRSKTVGAYLPQRLIENDATVLCYHSKSKIKDNEFEDCDAVISCVGKYGLISQKHFGNKRRCVCIDIGVSRGKDGKVKGDFAEDIRDYQYYTPYVNGVGLLTRVYLAHNYVQYMIYKLTDYMPQNHERLFILNENCADEESLIKHLGREKMWVYTRNYIKSIENDEKRERIKRALEYTDSEWINGNDYYDDDDDF